MNIRLLITALFPQYKKVEDDDNFRIDIKESIPERPDLQYCELVYVWTNDQHCFVVIYQYDDGHSYQEFDQDIPKDYTEQTINNILQDIKQIVIKYPTK